MGVERLSSAREPSGGRKGTQKRFLAFFAGSGAISGKLRALRSPLADDLDLPKGYGSGENGLLEGRRVAGWATRVFLRASRGGCVRRSSMSENSSRKRERATRSWRWNGGHGRAPGPRERKPDGTLATRNPAGGLRWRAGTSDLASDADTFKSVRGRRSTSCSGNTNG